MKNKIGALWLKQSKTGTEFMSGVIEINGETIKIVVFKNKKENDRQPDWQILKSETQEKTINEQINPEDIPF